MNPRYFFNYLGYYSWEELRCNNSFLLLMSFVCISGSKLKSKRCQCHCMVVADNVKKALDLQQLNRINVITVTTVIEQLTTTYRFKSLFGVCRPGLWLRSMVCSIEPAADPKYQFLSSSYQHLAPNALPSKW